MRAAAHAGGDREVTRRALSYLNVFRLVISVAMVLVSFSPMGLELTTGYQTFLARSASLIYFVSACAFLLLWQRDAMDMQELAGRSLATDLIIIAVLLHCFGGLDSGLGVLLIFTVGIAALLLPLRTALFFASLATLAMIVEAAIAHGTGIGGSGMAVQAAFYGIATFFTAIAAGFLGRWGREYQLLAERRTLDLANLEQINELIIRRMRSGVLVIDDSCEIRQMNEAAWYLLGNPAVSKRNLRVIAPALADRTNQWKETGRERDEGLLLQATQVAVVPRFLRLPGSHGEGTLIFLEDTSVISRRARDLAQASLARLSASIAHEIRNPLGALSHAAQLLKESEQLTGPDQRLVEIIGTHTARMNDIVENVLTLSRRERARPEQLNLITWLRDLAAEFSKQHQLPAGQIKLEMPSAALLVLVDAGQLRQAVSNLLENALRHGGSEGEPPQIKLRVSPIRGHREVAMDIIDNGPGIPLEKRSQIFEPFFTTHHKGSGLGLYLARQLCDANQAPLEYVQVPNAGACFRILLKRPESSAPVASSQTGTSSKSRAILEPRSK